jgi:hypothetical protein
MEVTNTMNENTYQRQSEPDPEKLVLPSLQPANESLYSDYTLELPMQARQEMPLTAPATSYYNTPGSSIGSSLPPTSNIYSRPPDPTMAIPLSANPRMRAGRKLSVVRVIWWFTLVGVIVASTIVVALFLPAVLAQQNQQGAAASATAIAQPTPTMLKPTPTPISKTLNDITFTPGQFLLTTDCQFDNGSRCTLTLQASSALRTRTVWLATAQPKTSIQFNPHQGTLRQGQRTQLIIFVKGTCPYEGSLLFTVKGEHLTVPLHC